MTEPLWYYRHDGRECGPVARDELEFLRSSGAVSPAAQIRRDDSQKWQPLSSIAGHSDGPAAVRRRARRFSPAAEFRGSQTEQQPLDDSAATLQPPNAPSIPATLHELPAPRRNRTLLYAATTLALLGLLIWYLWPESTMQGLASTADGTAADTANSAATDSASATAAQSSATAADTAEDVSDIDPAAQPAPSSESPVAQDANSTSQPATAGASGSGAVADTTDSPVMTEPEDDLAGVDEQQTDSSTPGLTVGEDSGSRFAISAPGETTFFGIRGAGRRFAYVVDCSGSMQGLPLQRAKQELLESIRKLPPHLEFCVVFFDDISYPFPQNRSRPFLKATQESIAECEAFVASISGGGGTNVKGAMNVVLTARVKPDTTFLLTDGQFDYDTPAEIKRWNPRTNVRINTIAFLDPSGEQLLRQIADENRGDYRFVP